MDAREVLGAAMGRGGLVRGVDVSGDTWPEAARTYLADGTGVAWEVPRDLAASGTFVIDAEIVAPVRASLARRYGITDPLVFAELWTRAECFAKLTDTPIITWLQHHGLDVPGAITQLAEQRRVAWATDRHADVTVTRALRLARTPGEE